MTVLHLAVTVLHVPYILFFFMADDAGGRKGDDAGDDGRPGADAARHVSQHDAQPRHGQHGHDGPRGGTLSTINPQPSTLNPQP